MNRKGKLIFFGIVFLIIIEFPISIFSNSLPESLKPLYKYLNDTLYTNNKWVDQNWDKNINSSFLPNASLIIANSNSVNPGYLTQSYLMLVSQYVKRLKELGCKSIQLDLQFPIFDHNFFLYAKNNNLLPKNGPDDTNYLAFYKKVA